MEKKPLIISAVILVLAIVCGVYFKFFYKKIDVDRIEAGDTITVLGSNASQMLNTLHQFPGFKNLSKGQQMKVDDKMGGCIMLALMQFPEVSEDNFQYLTLQQKIETVQQAIVKHQDELKKSFETCYRDLDQDVKQIIEAGGVI